eukprot:CAMPEP_0119403980 /NCGR_PEP_ID=MMETSP1334-20130426/143664_1 /TAXON_ID=127549 /ORGANISM="Calcidiscus leptoporus, Strain RCC1130" /LENGTH=390 /DNA_ID=CAMNT_0007427937 /DNA_START=20 /DNA_END=1192 /DNA_ORIENTATION=-
MMELDASKPTPASRGKAVSTQHSPPPLTSCQKFLSYLPMCGGWCIPNLSPEVTCVRNFSNENTMFKAFADSYRIRSYAEHSALMRRCGNCGVECAGRRRCSLMSFALLVSLFAWACFFIGACGMSVQASVLMKIPWTVTTFTREETDPSWKPVPGKVVFTEYWGIRGGVLTMQGVTLGIGPNGTVVWKVDSDAYTESAGKYGDPSWGCDVDSDSVSSGLFTPASAQAYTLFCTQCEGASRKAMIFVLFSVISHFLQVKKDLQRLTPYGDLNCQKFMGVVMGWISMITAFVSIIIYEMACSNQFPEELRGTVVKDGATYEVVAKAHRKMGLGVIFMMTGTCCKFVDGLIHLLVKTPAPKREPVADGITFVDYFLTCHEPTRFGQAIKEGSP